MTIDRNSGALIAVSLIATIVLSASHTRLNCIAAAAIFARETDTARAADPASSVWAEAGMTRVALSSDGQGFLRTATVRALSDGERLYVLVQWPDESPDWSFKGPYENIERGETVRDAAQLTFTAGKVEPVPVFELADSTGSVAIWRWKSQWQRAVETAASDVVGDRAPVQIADDYPFEHDTLYYPARAAGNENARDVRQGSSDELIATRGKPVGRHPATELHAKGGWSDGYWNVLFVRPLASPGDPAPIFSVNRSAVQVALWDGGLGDRKASRAVSTAIPIYAKVPASANAARVAGLEGGR